ncbi:MAG TPA: efflux RND transporter periplasmic adaptor subunit [Burkholderiales bacterium]|nr:efflux RND transporter periplasmic adaptor subunit [Burkholderiales bacterium]
MSGRGKAISIVLVLAVLGAATAVYFINDSRAKESKKGGRGPAAVPVSVTPALQQSVPVRLQAIGNVEAYSTVSVKARVDGQIVALNFKEGQEIKKGDVLFRIDARPYEATLKQAEANALRDAAARNQAQSQERRYKELLEKNFISKEAYAQIATNAQTAEATAGASQAALENARLNVEYCTIISPLDGYVGKVLLQVGNHVKANDVSPLVVINQVRPIYVNFAVPEQSLTALRGYMAAGPLAVEVSPSGETKMLAEGRLIFVDNAVDPSTGTIRLRGQFDNKDIALWPGQFVNVRVRLFDQTNAILIPARSVQTGPEGQYVYVVKADKTAELRKITVERSEGEQVVVKGLAKDEQVVTRGALRLAPGVRVEIRTSAEAAS